MSLHYLYTMLLHYTVYSRREAKFGRDLVSLPICVIIDWVIEMDKEKEIPQRKHPRLKHYDYSSPGAYFITICTQNRRCVLSHIVGRGLAPADACTIEHTLFGKIAEKQLLLMEKRYPFVVVDRYVIMPNHIHVVLILDHETAGASPCPAVMDETAGASPRPTIMDIVCAYKSLTTRECKKNGLDEKMFQTSFYEHIIRGQEDYEKIANYIYENPMRWYYDELYTEE